jgi:hypothetical protein
LVSVIVSIGALAALCGCAGGASAARFCDDVGRVPVISSADQLRGSGGQATLADLRTALDHLHGRSPDPVADDVATLSRVTGQLQEALRSQDAGDEASADRLRGDLDASLSTFEAASARVVAYSQQTCGLHLDTAASTTAATTKPGGTPPAPGDDVTTTTAAP